MNWGENPELLKHWQLLGKFRQSHPSVGAGKHMMISESPYTFSRSYTAVDFTDNVVVAIVEPEDTVTIKVGENLTGKKVRDAYTGKTYKVKNGEVSVNSKSGIILLEEI